MDIALSEVFTADGGWQEVVSGTGQISYDDTRRIATCIGSPGDTAYLRHRFLAMPGDHIVAMVDAKSLTHAEGSVVMGLDMPAGIVRCAVKIDSDQRMPYSVEGVVGEGVGPQEVSLILGARSTLPGGGMFMRPRLRILQGGIGTLRTVAAGRVVVGQKGALMDSTARRIGVRGAVWRAELGAIVVSLSDLVPDNKDGAAGLVPLLSVNASFVGLEPGSSPLHWTADIDWPHGEMILTPYTWAGEKVDIAQLANAIYTVTFKAEI